MYKMEYSNKEIAKRFIEEIVNTGNTNNISEFIDPKYIDHNDKEHNVTGIEGAKAHIIAVRGTYPDLKVSIEQQICEGDTVVSHIIGRATHSGEWLGMKPTNKQITIHGVNIDKFKNNKIIEHWGMANSLEALLEIGAFPIDNK